MAILRSLLQQTQQNNVKKVTTLDSNTTPFSLLTAKNRSMHQSFLVFAGYFYNTQDYEDLANKPLPRIISRSETIRAAYGERVLLPCNVEQLGKYKRRHEMNSLTQMGDFYCFLSCFDFKHPFPTLFRLRNTFMA